MTFIAGLLTRLLRSCKCVHFGIGPSILFSDYLIIILFAQFFSQTVPTEGNIHLVVQTR